ncbi:MAG: A24 family peptidase C-terminal domain-containing protein [Candidatus Thermoplasmatota archaeon]|nr:A24 family peptidase C-terminal domain-containing protein [Candidatus Thermoplasmatota archaeon]
MEFDRMSDYLSFLDLGRFIVGVIILSYASYTDIKTRRAPNILWIIMGTIGCVFLVIQYLLTGFSNQLMYLVFIPIMIFLMYVLFQLGLIFGGADAKALMALAILVPILPTIFGFPLAFSFMPYSWVIFSNSVVLFLVLPVSLFIYNMIKGNRIFPQCFLGYPLNLEEAKHRFVWPLERIIAGKRKISYKPSSVDELEIYGSFEKAGIKEIWVTPKVPFMIPLLAGFITAFIVGDILTIIIGIFL